jgi:hypothetical protein
MYQTTIGTNAVSPMDSIVVLLHHTCIDKMQRRDAKRMKEGTGPLDMLTWAASGDVIFEQHDESGYYIVLSLYGPPCCMRCRMGVVWRCGCSVLDILTGSLFKFLFPGISIMLTRHQFYPFSCGSLFCWDARPCLVVGM